MALVNCKYCGKQTNRYASSCSLCGAKMGSGNFKILIYAVVGFCAFIGLMLAVSERQKAESKREEELHWASLTPEQKSAEIRATRDERKAEQTAREDSSARFACHEFVMKSLHDPRSAEMESSAQHYSTKEKDGTYFVQVSGRAKNGFGSLRRVAFNCKTKKIGSNWILVSIKQIDF